MSHLLITSGNDAIDSLWLQNFLDNLCLQFFVLNYSKL